MSAKVKKAGRIGTKIVAAFLFVFLVMFNVQIGMHDGGTSDISLLGLKLSIFIPSAFATNDHGGGSGGGITCYASSGNCYWFNWDCDNFWRCQPGGSCFQDEGRNPYDPSTCYSG